MEVSKSCGVLLMITLVLGAASASDLDSNNSCDTLKSLAHGLYNYTGNIENMTKVFFPPLQDAGKFLRVKYHFLDQNDDSDNCSVSYIWAEGGFLLIQPPLIFQFTSLFFNHIANNEYNPHLDLKLPNACRHLVQVDNSTKNCSCKQNTSDGDYDLLDMLTHQVHEC